MKFTNHALVHAILVSPFAILSHAALRGGLAEPDGSSYTCYIDSLQRLGTSGTATIQGILKLGPGTFNKNGSSLWQEGWRFDPDGKLLTVDPEGQSVAPTWCHDTGSSNEMRYDVQFAFGNLDETFVVVSSESSLPKGQTSWTRRVQAMSEDGSPTGAYFEVKCDRQPVSCEAMGFIYDHQNLDPLEVRKEEIDEVFMEGDEEKAQSLQEQLEKDMEHGFLETKAGGGQRALRFQDGNRTGNETETDNAGGRFGSDSGQDLYQQDEVFYEDVPDIPKEEIEHVIDWIAAEVAQERLPFCWRDSYGRGVGKIPTECPSGKEKIGALCYSKCPSGMKRFGFDCHSVCPSGFRDDGLFCRKAEYGRGAGYPWKFGDGFNDRGMYKRCEARHGRGNCEKWGAIVYPKCRAGYKPFGCCICRPAKPDCPSLGLNNGIDLSCGKKIQIGDPTTMICRSNLENDAGLCYPKCRGGYNGVGPVCWQNCDSDQTNCGAGCASSGTDCGFAIWDQVTAPIILAANIATLGLVTPATGAANAATDTITVGGKVLTASSRFGKTLISTVKTLQTIKPGVGKGATIVQTIRHARLGTKLDTVTTLFDYGRGYYDAIQNFRNAFEEDFAELTSPEINRMLDQNFHPITARFLKGIWADRQFAEMAEVWGWNIGSNILAAAALVDISGVTGVVSAYAKPICAAIIPFPCLEDIDVNGC
eukprot:scaffold111_cov149-Amphora_coffeaeformis.AAC.11